MNMISYTDCCSKLERIASKRRIYGSQSTLRLNKKGSKFNSPVENIQVKGDNRIPFICAGSANKSHHIGINIQTTLSIIQQYPGQNPEQNYLMNGSNNLHTGSKLNKSSRTSMSHNFSEMQICPARAEDKCIASENNIFNEIDLNPWAVDHYDDDPYTSEYCQQNNSCSCPSRCMDSYYTVMAPFMKHLKRKQKLCNNAVQNPYTKARVLQYYDLLTRRVQDLKLTMITMNNGLVILTEKYNKLYEQHVRNPDRNLVPILLQTEDELKILKSKVEEAVDVYKEAVSLNSQSESSMSLLAHIEAENVRHPKETTSVRLAKVLRRVQLLQERLKNGHFLNGSGDQ